MHSTPSFFRAAMALVTICLVTQMLCERNNAKTKNHRQRRRTRCAPETRRAYYETKADAILVQKPRTHFAAACENELLSMQSLRKTKGIKGIYRLPGCACCYTLYREPMKLHELGRVKRWITYGFDRTPNRLQNRPGIGSAHLSQALLWWGVRHRAFYINTQADDLCIATRKSVHILNSVVVVLCCACCSSFLPSSGKSRMSFKRKTVSVTT